MKKITTSVLIALVMLSSCKKDTARTSEVCYQCKDASGNNITKFCGSDESDAYQQASDKCINGNCHMTRSEFLTTCPLQ